MTFTYQYLGDMGYGMVAKQGVCIPHFSDRGECEFGHGGVLWE